MNKEKSILEKKFLNENVFNGLTDLNDGFDSPGIRYFSEVDFEKILERCEKYGLTIFGIEA